MALTDRTSDPIATSPSARLAGPDVVRAVALVGVVVMNYHGYLLLRSAGGTGDGWAARLFDPWIGPLSTRFAATFVLVAGVGVVLLTRRALGDPARVSAARWRLARRGVLLYVVGLLVDEVWPGSILPYYGAMFVIGALLFTLRTRWIMVVGIAAALAGATIRLWRFDRERGGASTRWLTAPSDGSIRRYVFDVFVNGTHPLLPWLAFLCAGMVLGRVLHTSWWRRAAIGGGLAMIVGGASLSWFADDPATRWVDVVTSLRPLERGAVYVTSALGSALVAYATIDWLAERFPTATEPLRRAGQLSLTLYLLHVVVFEVVVDHWRLVEPSGLDTALGFALVFWIAAIPTAAAWQRRFGRGPAEYVYRAFGG